MTIARRLAAFLAAVAVLWLLGLGLLGVTLVGAAYAVEVTLLTFGLPLDFMRYLP